MSGTIAVQSGHVIQCPQCWSLMSTMGSAAAQAEGIIEGSIHLVCPTCVMKDVAPPEKKPESKN